MHLRPNAYIDLTGHLGSLQSSLTPDSKLFEPAQPLWQLTQRPEPSHTILTLFWLWLLITAAGCALMAAI